MLEVSDGKTLKGRTDVFMLNFLPFCTAYIVVHNQKFYFDEDFGSITLMADQKNMVEHKRI